MSTVLMSVEDLKHPFGTLALDFCAVVSLNKYLWLKILVIERDFFYIDCRMKKEESKGGILKHLYMY